MKNKLLLLFTFLFLISTVAAQCTLNGEEVPCSDFAGPLGAIFGVGVLFFFLIMVLQMHILWEEKIRKLTAI